MSDPQALIVQLRRSNRRWKALALAACSALVLAALVGFVAMSGQRIRAEHAMRAAQDALATAHNAADSALPR
jgi:hypothetical protein